MPADKDPSPRVVYGVRDEVSNAPGSPSQDDRSRLQFQERDPAIVYKAYPSLLSEQLLKGKPLERIFGAHEIEKRAVWIVHGMGQQIPFETLDSVTEGILSVAKLPSHAKEFQPVACSVRVGDEVLQRVELKVRSEDDTRDVELHLYEAYWAPLTEGVAKLTDVAGFLVNGAVRGILNSFKPFKRAIFGDVCEFKVQKRVPFYISIVLLLLASLAIINTVVIAATGNKLKLFGFQFDPTMKGWPAVTAEASVMAALAISLGAILFLAGMCKSQSDGNLKRKSLSLISWLATAITSLGIVLTAAIFALAAIFASVRAWLVERPAAQLQFFSTAIILGAIASIGLALLARGSQRSNAKATVEQSNVSQPLAFPLLFVAFLLQLAAIACVAASLCDPLHAWMQDLMFTGRIWNFLASPWWVWPFLIFLSSQVRTLMIEYVGDVAIYVTSNKIDRFSEVRQKIKSVAYTSASAVFHAMADDDHFLYEKVAIVGHSLGSEIAYDTLDQLINEDRMTNGHLRIAERTCLFETFGSPLNKIAFFFTIQGSDNFQIREQLAESVQPLIMDYKFRPFPWVNIRSLNDIISGAVYFYEWPAQNSKIAIAPKNPVAGTLTFSPQGTSQGTGTLKGYQKVDDKKDPAASIALAAHTEYWKNEMVWDELYKHVTK